jgi:zinc finger protein
LRRVITAPCPVCSKDIQYIYLTERIPYFSEVMLAHASCDCGFKSVDTMVMGDNNPIRYTVKVDGEDDLAIRVVRSSKGTIEIPEFGILVEPGPMCEAFISNVEGVLLRILTVVEGIITRSDEEPEKANAIALKERLERAREGKEPFTLIIQDINGNSGIVSKKARKSEYVPYGDVPEES